MTKKQRAALAKAEAEAQRLALIEEYARLERERIEEEARQAKERELMKLKLEEEQEKREEEHAEIQVWLGERTVEVELWDSDAEAAEAWARHVECEPLPDPRSEREMNTYLRLWAEASVADHVEALNKVQESNVVVADIERVLARAFERSDTAAMARLEAKVAELRSVATTKIDALTAHLIQHADAFTDDKLECQVEVALPDVRYALWVNVAKNLRVKSREFRDVGITTSISKGLALASVAMRFVHTNWDNLTPTSVSDEYMTLGGILHFDLLDVPPSPKTLKGWTLRPVTELAHTVRRLGYPIVPPGTDPASAPVAPSPSWKRIKITWIVPDAVFVRSKSPLLGWWDAQVGIWRTDGIEASTFDPVTRVLSFETIHAAPTALLQPRYIDLPFEHWLLAPAEPNKAMLSLMGGEMQIVVEIGEGYCRLTKPLDDCFKELRNSRLSPYLFMIKLARIGINMIPTNASVPRLTGVRVKDRSLEDALHAELCLLAPSFSLGYSKWNAGRSAKKAVLKIRQALDQAAASEAPAASRLDPGSDIEPYLTILYDHRHHDAAVLKANDDSEHFTEEKQDGLALHRNVYNCVKEVCLQEAIMVCRAASDRFTESVRHMLNIVRLMASGSESQNFSHAQKANLELKAELEQAEADMETFREKVKFKLASQISERRRLTERAEALQAENEKLAEQVAATRGGEGEGGESGSGSASGGEAMARSVKPVPPPRPKAPPRTAEEAAEAAMLIEHIRQAESEAEHVQRKVRIKLQHLVIEKHALNIRLQELENSENSMSRMQEMRTQLAQLLDDKTTLMQQWTELKATMENAQLWQTQNAQLERQIQLVDSQRAEAQAKMDKLTAALNANLATKAEARKSKKKLGARIEKRKEILARERDSQKHAAQWKAQNEFLRAQMAKIRKVNVVLAAKVEDAQAISLDSSNSREGAALAAQVASNEAAMAELRTTIAELESAKAAFESEAAALTSDVEALVAEVTGAKMKIQTLTRTATKSAATNADYRRTLLNVLEEKGMLSLRVNELLSKLKLLEEWEEENDELYFGIQELLDENARLQQRLAQLRAAAEASGDSSLVPDAMDVSLNAATKEILEASVYGTLDGDDVDRFAEMRRAFGMELPQGAESGGGEDSGSGHMSLDMSASGEGSSASPFKPGRASLRRIKGRTYSEAKLSELHSLLQDPGDASDVAARIQKAAEAKAAAKAKAKASAAAEAEAAGASSGDGAGKGGESDASLSLSLLTDDSPEAYFADKRDIKFMSPEELPAEAQSGAAGGGSSYPSVKCGTLYRLVERLTFEKYPDMEYVQAFMLTYRSFTNPIALMEKMIERYCITAPASLDAAAQAEFKKRKLVPIRLRVYNVLRGWLDKYFRDFEENEDLLAMLKDFASNIMTATGMKRPAAGKAKKLSFESLPPPPKSQIISNPFSINIKDLARNMCLLEMQMYQAIPVTECLNNRWSGPNKAKTAPSIFRTIVHFNTTTMWVTTEVVQNTKLKPKARAKIIAYFIKLAMELKALNNLNGVMEVVAGLSNASVRRLKRAWARVDSKLIAEFDSLKSLTSNHRAYAMLRNHIRICKPPCIPYLGVHLTDLTFIEDGNDDQIDGGLINMVKRRMAANVIRDILQYQHDSYPFEVSLPIAHYLVNMECKDDDACYDLSLLAEPRQ
ncbi:uncharacterized protein AMSG_11933 [Thecamonas trahens ATCC 50062]|uniref:Uncharacterized protein n=1 Tax=Thecamonas trahens ATCC 50062 TaxID=461836 RepID=A0A0L0DBZ3_THETB|nr:hypothetical protein AMSG_11933 [Thecamonas trahens ATCC 50062]KNC49760.1 hypothetical protein AMSG_11933 [Thecamonas trahens ATCC 50062]|eukprot:XP_013757613.1 hypothetical protein AMSG_11933 [Thecamonas trahens ATCC 50062]